MMQVRFTGDPSGEGTNPVAVQFGGKIFPLHEWVELPSGFDPIVARKLQGNAHFETEGEPPAMPDEDAAENGPAAISPRSEPEPEPPAPVKRGPGRPRKNPLPDVS